MNHQFLLRKVNVLLKNPIGFQILKEKNIFFLIISINKYILPVIKIPFTGTGSVESFKILKELQNNL